MTLTDRFFRVLCKPWAQRIVSDRTYYWLLDRLTDNDGWRPLSVRYPEHFGGKS